MESIRILIPLLLLLSQMVGSSENGTMNKQMHSTTTLASHGNTSGLTNVSGSHFIPSSFMQSAYGLLHVSNKLIATVAVLAIVTNSFLILLILIDPIGKLRKSKCTVIIVNLALADLLTGWASILYSFPVDLSWFKAIFIVLSVGYTVSLFTLVVFTIERFIATLFPLKIKQLVTFGKTFMVCLFTWVAGIIVGTNGFLIQSETNMAMHKVRIARIAVQEVSILLVVILNICIIISVRRHANRFKQVRSSNGVRRQQHQLNVVLTLLVILLVITVLPFLVVTQMYHIIRLSGPLDNNSLLHSFVRVFPRLFMPFGLFNYVLNPIIYAWRLYDYRMSVAGLFCQKCQKRTFRTSNPSRTGIEKRELKSTAGSYITSSQRFKHGVQASI